MKIGILLATGLAMAIALPSAAATITFDQLPTGTPLPATGTTISTQYAGQGVTFLGIDTVTGNTGALNAWGLIAATGPGGSGNYLGNFGAITPSSPVPGPSDYLLAPRYNVMSVSFANVVSGIAFGLNTGGGQNAVTINTYNAAGTLIQSLVGVTANEGRFEIKSLSANDVSRIEILAGFNANTSVRLFGIDNLTFTVNPVVAPVPEPATWTMMIAGFGAIGAAMRRRKGRTAVTAG